MTSQSERRAYVSEPAPIVPVAAAVALRVRGQRVIVGSVAKGWRTDLRADELVSQGDKSYVPVLPEHDWYRSEVEQVETFAPLVAIDRVWVEATDHSADDLRRIRSSTAGEPRVRWPIRAHQLPRLLGQRLVWLKPDMTEGRDLRAVSEPYGSLVRIADELEWYRWGWTGKPPRTIEVPLDDLWAE